jgi:hypothetical protein
MLHSIFIFLNGSFQSLLYAFFTFQHEILVLLNLKNNNIYINYHDDEGFQFLIDVKELSSCKARG